MPNVVGVRFNPVTKIYYFDPDSVPEPNNPASPDDIDQLKIGGLGIHFMRSLMDDIQFESSAGGGNKLGMVKYLSENNRP